jgi:uncharacterized protein (DUF2147 family)
MRQPIHIIGAAAPAALVLAVTLPASAASVEGLWSLGEGRAQISISECGDGLCGRIVQTEKLKVNPDIVDKKNRNPLLRLRKIKGLQILAGFVGGPSEWKNGTIYNPDDGSTYRATIRLVDENTIKAVGCIVWPLCKSTKLTRVAGEGAAKVEESAAIVAGNAGG